MVWGWKSDLSVAAGCGENITNAVVFTGFHFRDDVDLLIPSGSLWEVILGGFGVSLVVSLIVFGGMGGRWNKQYCF